MSSNESQMRGGRFLRGIRGLIQGSEKAEGAPSASDEGKEAHVSLRMSWMKHGLFVRRTMRLIFGFG